MSNRRGVTPAFDDQQLITKANPSVDSSCPITVASTLAKDVVCGLERFQVMAVRHLPISIRSVLTWGACFLVCAFPIAVVVATIVWILPRAGEAALGLRIDGKEISPGSHPRKVAEDRAVLALRQHFRFTWDGEEVLQASAEQLGGTVDIDALAREIADVGHQSSWLDRIASALAARRGKIDIPVHVSLPVEVIAARLEEFKNDHDNPPVAAKFDFVNKTATDHQPGRYLDIYALATAIDSARCHGDGALPIPAFAIEPSASHDVVATIDVSQVLVRFETRFGYLGPHANRAHNIQRAATSMNGVVLMPNEIVSFNHHVGPRSIENGFATAPEIYKGEMRDGIGGGTCQVAGTLHAAAVFAGIQVAERSNHSRPSGYIRMGLDATVVYPTVDLRLKNPYEFPIVIQALIDRGTLAFELRGHETPATVDFVTTTIGVEPFDRKVEETPFVAEGKFVLKQKGIRGISIRKRRIIHLRNGKEQVEMTTDVYPPTFEIYLVAPGADIDTLLPPLAHTQEMRTASNDVSQAAELTTRAPVSGAN